MVGADCECECLRFYYENMKKLDRKQRITLSWIITLSVVRVDEYVNVNNRHTGAGE